VPFLQQGDVIMDGGNSFYLDSIEREKTLWDEDGIYFLDCGTSGGLDGARNGA
jgi:6-phosphogluconate dehydrogenase